MASRPTVRWRSLLLALAGFLLVPAAPTALRAVLPITETWVLLAATFAVCAALGWWNGGHISLAIVAVAFALLAALAPVGVRGTPYAQVVHGWVLLLAAAFGFASLLRPGQPFFARALVATGIAIGAAFVLAIVQPDGLALFRGVMQAQYTARAERMITDFEAQTATPAWRETAKQHPALDSMVTRVRDQSDASLRSLPGPAAGLVPALLALESLAALALAWALYHRLSGVPLGPALGPMRDLKFNDQLVWGLAVGGAIYFLPQFSDAREAGLNLLLFFGTLYLLRGVGVLSWMTRGKTMGLVLIVATVLVPMLVAALAFAVGVADTWMDWRGRAQSAA